MPLLITLNYGCLFDFFKENKINKMLATLTRKKGKPKMTVINYEKDNTTDNKENIEKK